MNYLHLWNNLQQYDDNAQKTEIKDFFNARKKCKKKICCGKEICVYYQKNVGIGEKKIN